MTLKQIVALLGVVAIFIVTVLFWDYIVTTFTVLAYFLAALGGVFVAIILFLAASPLLKKSLTHNPNTKDQLGLFVEVGTGKGVAIDFGGNFYYSIIGGELNDYGDGVLQEGPVPSDALFGLWMLYKRYIWWATKLHVYVPFFTVPKSYDLPRYDVIERDGKRVYRVIDEGNPKYRSNHVRVAPFTWYFEFAGAEIQTVPFMIKGSAQVRIDSKKIVEALYLTESWNVLLDQALNATIRSVVRSEATLDLVIGSVNKDIWVEKAPEPELSNKITAQVLKRLSEYEFQDHVDDGITDAFAGKKLADLGLLIFKVDITDFEYDGLSIEEMKGLRAAILGRQKGRAIDQEGQGTAAAQQKLVEVLASNPEMAKIISGNEALVRAAAAGNLDALLAAFIQKTRGN
jgi:hypothetical protein